MNDKVNESGQFQEYMLRDHIHAQPSSIEPRVRRGMRRLLADVGATHALRELATLCESHAAGMIIDSAKLAFCDAAVHIHRAAALVDGYLVPRGPVDPMNRVIGEVRACGIGRDNEDYQVVELLLASYRETARKLNEAKDTLGLRAVDQANIAALRKTLGHISEISAANLETLNANGLVAKVLAILNDPTDTCEVSASSVERLRAALIAHAKDTNPHDTATGFTSQAAEVIVNLAKQLSRITDLNKRLDAVEASVAQEAEAQAIATDKLTGHPIGCEAHFAGIRFHCHKTHKRYYEDRRQTFVTFEVYATTQLDREAINALRHHAEVATIAPLHTALLGKVKGYARLTSWPAYPATSEAEATFQFELHATQEEAEEANRHRFGHQGHVDQAKVMLDGKVIAEGSIEMLRGETVPRSTDLYQALVDMMSLLWKARFHEEPATEDASPAAEFVNEHQATLEKLADAFADPLDDFLIVPLGAKDGAADTDESATSPHASPFEGKPLDDTDPRNQVHALIEEHGSYGRPFGKSLSFNRDGLLVNDQPHAMNEPIKLVVALLELEQAAPTDLKGYGFTDAAMLVPAASNATREHAAICLAYAGLFHDLRQALQRSLSGLATSAKYNAEQSSDMLAYWTAELARMPIPAAPATKPTHAS